MPMWSSIVLLHLTLDVSDPQGPPLLLSQKKCHINCAFCHMLRYCDSRLHTLFSRCSISCLIRSSVWEKAQRKLTYSLLSLVSQFIIKHRAYAIFSLQKTCGFFKLTGYKTQTLYGILDLHSDLTYISDRNFPSFPQIILNPSYTDLFPFPQTFILIHI